MSCSEQQNPSQKQRDKKFKKKDLARTKSSVIIKEILVSEEEERHGKLEGKERRKKF